MHLYFIGICGTAMGQVATLMQQMGHTVSGSDKGVYPPMSDVLSAAGITVHSTFAAKNLENLQPGPDIIVVGNAVSRGNPEVEWTLNQAHGHGSGGSKKNIPFVSLPQLINQQCLGPGVRPVVIAGTHGKTTTASLAAHILQHAGHNPGWLIGGVPNNLPTGAHLAQPASNAPFIIEGDEYDCAFFDKRSKFIHYKPYILGLNNLEFDHADIFENLAHIQRSFSHATRLVPSCGAIVASGQCPGLAPLIAEAKTHGYAPVYTVGTEPTDTLQITHFKETPSGSTFTLIFNNEEAKPTEPTLWANVQWNLSGLHNARNAALGALCAALSVHNNVGAVHTFPLEAALNAFTGVKRRQEIILESTARALSVLTDFAHHPTAIKGTLEALKARYPTHHLIACLEPRSNTLRTAHFQTELASALAPANTVHLAPVHNSAHLENPLNTAHLAATHPQGYAHPSMPALQTALLSDINEASPSTPTLIVLLSNGAFGGLPANLVQALSE